MSQVQPEGYEPPDWTRTEYEPPKAIEAKRLAKDQLQKKWERQRQKREAA
ncbi:hypothetical protein GCM10007979_14460 [Nocardioides albus]|uniref:Uncharacterized protein n=1 Tax=Nocardioides albus TaxID=1841 RepID=A0A7W5F7U6_9ACTN|nr:hypothetical protein [Nocardioides albus]GGU17114.1 hypothetical protein GCM10007979_14460 [Nocardioides albus]